MHGVSAVPKEMGRCIKVRKKICMLWKPEMAAGKGKGVNMISKGFTPGWQH